MRKMQLYSHDNNNAGHHILGCFMMLITCLLIWSPLALNFHITVNSFLLMSAHATYEELAGRPGG